jgi:hypothetical protein
VVGGASYPQSQVEPSITATVRLEVIVIASCPDSTKIVIYKGLRRSALVIDEMFAVCRLSKTAHTEKFLVGSDNRLTTSTGVK